MDIGKMSLTELRRTQKRIDAEIRKRSDSAKKDLLKKMQRLAADHGMKLEDVVGGGERKASAPRKPRAKPAASGRGRKKITVAPKYRNPTDASMTWTGRGRKPLWVQKHLDDGKKLEDLLIAA